MATTGALLHHGPGVAARHLAEPLTLLPAVAAKLDGAVGRVAVVTAPAGYGKSAQVARWAEGDDRRSVWLELDGADDEPAVLLHTLLAALADLGRVDRAALASRRRHDDPMAAEAPLLGRAVRRIARPFVLVVDDVHLVRAPAAVALLEAVARNVPPPSTLVIVGRDRPPLELARLHAMGAAASIGAGELTIGTSEGRAILGALGVELDDASVRRIVRLAHGWPMGVRLLGAAARATGALAPDDHDGVTRSPLLVDYLREEWLGDLEPGDAEVLTRLAALDTVSLALCDHLLDRAGAGDDLVRLRRRGLLLPTDDPGLVRLHPLVRVALEPDPRGRRARRTVERACDWWEQEGEIERAVQTALAAGALDRASQLAVDHGPDLVGEGRGDAVAGWIDAFPAGHVAARPPLAIVAALAAHSAGDDAGAGAWLRFAETAVDPQWAGRLEIVRMLLGQRPVEGLGASPSEGLWYALLELARAVAPLAAAEADLDGVAARLEAAAAVAHALGARAIEATSRAARSVVVARQGDRRSAAAEARTARALIGPHGLDDRGATAFVAAVAAADEITAGDPERGGDDLLLARSALAAIGRRGWRATQTRLALAEASLRLDDRSVARSLVDEVARSIEGVPDTALVQLQLDEVRARLAEAHTAIPAGTSTLSAAELRVLHHLPSNLTHQEIAERLYLSRNTVKTHAAAIYRKLGVTSRREAVGLARAIGLLPADRRG